MAYRDVILPPRMSGVYGRGKGVAPCLVLCARVCALVCACKWDRYGIPDMVRLALTWVFLILCISAPLSLSA